MELSKYGSVFRTLFASSGPLSDERPRPRAAQRGVHSEKAM